MTTATCLIYNFKGCAALAIKVVKITHHLMFFDMSLDVSKLVLPWISQVKGPRDKSPFDVAFCIKIYIKISAALVSV